MSYLLETDKLTKIYGKQKAVNEVNVHLEKGAIYGFIGRNGAGKTTFLKMICGMAKPTSGDITLFGKKNNDRASEMKKIGVLIEDPGIFPGMTAYDNLKLKCKAAGINKEGYIEDILKTIGLALVGDPELLLLDEPINGLDPQGILEVREMLTSLVKERNMTIIISSHILEELSKVATHFGIIDNGVLIKELSHDELVEECRERIKLITDGSSQAAAEAVKSLGINKMNIIDDNNIEILEGFDSVPEMVFALAEKKIRVKSISVANDSIEEYFIKLTGGKNNA